MLKGKKILLRPLLDSDLEFLYMIENDKENWKFGSERKQYSKNELINYISNAKNDIRAAKQYRFVIDFKDDPIGFIDLYDYSGESAWVGVIVDKDYRNKRFAKEALDTLVNYSRHILGLNQLHANISSKNLLSIKLFTSCGFRVVRNTENYNILLN